MRRALLVIGAGCALIAAVMTWEAKAQSGGRNRASSLAVSESRVGAPLQAKIDINHASHGELERLPGITAALAARIVKFRPYRKLDDLVTRKVLGKKQFAQIREFVAVSQDSQ